MRSQSGTSQARAASNQDLLSRVVFGSAIFLSAFLLFQIQTLMAKFLLPWFGGAAAVWTTCMLFFQVLLLLGYAYAHWISTRLRAAWQFGLHLSLLTASLAMLGVHAFLWNSPIVPGPDWKPENGDTPITGLLLLLSVTVGLPFLILSATSPLLQKWLNLIQSRDGAKSEAAYSTYKLYALSNVGSMLGLLSYPFLVEPNLRLSIQAKIWSAGYFCFALLCAACARTMYVKSDSAELAIRSQAIPVSFPVRKSTRILWFSLSLCGSLMLLATTNLICQDLGVVPLLWVLPLSLYLLSFILCFGDARIYRRELFHPGFAFAALLAWLTLLLGQGLPAISQIYVFSLVLFIICMVCHGELSKLKPDAQHLTSFYLTVSAGGAAGGLVVGVIAPLLFRGYWEYHIGLFLVALSLLTTLFLDRESWVHEGKAWVPLALASALALLPRFLVSTGWIRLHPRAAMFDWLLLAVLLPCLAYAAWRGSKKRLAGNLELRFMHAGLIIALVLFAVVLERHIAISERRPLAQTRSFYGVLSVTDQGVPGSEFEFYELLHGKTSHGIQLRRTEYKRALTSYYTRKSGVGLAILNYPRTIAPNGAIRVGAVGLGVGTISAYLHPGDLIRFYEINPQVIRLALGDHAMFSYLADAAGRFEIVRGDARISLEREAAENNFQDFDILVLDAFSGDAIPVHLLTREALQSYMKHLRGPESVIAVHISNKSLDLAPIVAGLAHDQDLNATLVTQEGDGGAISASDWILLSKGVQTLNAPAVLKAGLPLIPNKAAPLWTDDHSDLFSVLKH